MDESRKEDEERALAFAALALVKAVIAGLERKGLLEERDVQEVFDGALTSLEFRVQDSAIGLARRIIEGIVVTRDTQRPADGPAPQDPTGDAMDLTSPDQSLIRRISRTPRPSLRRGRRRRVAPSA